MPVLAGVGAGSMDAYIAQPTHDDDDEHDHGHSHDDDEHDHGHAPDGDTHDHDHSHDHGPDHGHAHDHGPDHGHAHDDGHAHDHDHAHDTRRGHDHGHSHGHGGARHHHTPDDLSWRGVVGMGAAAGLIPCPSALVVLLGAISQQEVGLGLVLIVAFSLGLAATLTGLGLAVVYAKRFTDRMDGPLTGRIAVALPAVSAAIIVGVGLLLTVRALPQVM